MAQKTQSSNWVFKLSLYKILFQSILALNLHSKEINLESFFYFKLFICAPDVKRPTFSEILLPEHESFILKHIGVEFA